MPLTLDQEQLTIAWALQNPDGFQGLSELMGEKAFNKPPWNLLWPPLLKAYQRHESFPRAGEVAQVVDGLDCEGASKLFYASLLQGLYTLDVSQFTGGMVKEYFAREQLDRLTTNLANHRTSNDPIHLQLQQATEAIERIANLTASKKSFGIAFNPDDNLLNWKQLIEEEYGTRPVTTGINRLNKKLRDGGLRNILALMVGATGGFKTTTLLNAGWDNLREIRYRHPDGRVRGGRVVHFFSDDNRGEISQRRVAHLLQRPLRMDDYAAGNWEAVGRLADARRRACYPGTFWGVEIDPDTYSPKDFLHHLQELKHEYALEDKQLAREGWPIPPAEWGDISMGVIDVGDDVKDGESSKAEGWASEEKKFRQLGLIPKKLKFPLWLSVQGNQSLVGASQGTLRNIGVSYGKSKPAKLIVTVVQTASQSQQLRTIDPKNPQVAANLHHMWTYNPSSDRNTEWEAFGICINKNTYGNGEGGNGLVRNVMLPMLGHLASCRITEDYTAADELLRSPGQTQTEERMAAGEMPPNKSGKRGSK